jgi:pimeloyl-ACP methyl ester carboxylesterase
VKRSASTATRCGCTDYGSQIGLRHAIAHPDRITALIIQNGDIYEDVLGPKYAAIKAWWKEKTPEKHRPLEKP